MILPELTSVTCGWVVSLVETNFNTALRDEPQLLTSESRFKFCVESVVQV